MGYVSWVDQARFNRMHGTVCVKEFGAAGDGIHDDTVAIQQAEDKASLEKRILYFPPGIYCVNGIKKRSYSCWKGESKHCSIVKHTGKGTTPLVYNESEDDGLVQYGFSDLTFDGNRDGSVDDNGVPNGGTVQRATIIFSYNPSLTTNTISEDFHMENCIIRNAPYEQMPFHLKGVKRVNVHGNYVYDSGKGLFHCFYARRCEFVRVTNNHITGNARENKGIKVQQSPTSLIANNTVENCAQGIHSQDTRYVTIVGNAVTNCNEGINSTPEQSSYGNRFLTITGNVVSDCDSGINLVSTESFTCASNVISNCINNSFYVRGCRFGVFSNNTLRYGLEMTVNHNFFEFPDGGTNNDVVITDTFMRDDATNAVGNTFFVTAFNNLKSTTQAGIIIKFAYMFQLSGSPNLVLYNNCAPVKYTVDVNNQITL